MLRSIASFAFLAAAAAAQSPFTFGNVVVVRVGDGAAPLSSAAAATFLDEYTPTGTLVQSIAMPVTPTGLNQAFTIAGTSTSEGFLNLSPNGLWLTLTGYSATPGTLAVPTTSATTTPRVIARVDLTGAIDTSTTITDAYSGTPTTPTANGNIRSAVTVDGAGFWVSGQSAGAAGVRFATLGGSTTVGINAGAPSNVRVVGVYLDQLYASSASTVWQGVSTVGTGLPTSGPQSLTLLNGFPTASGPSAYDFWFQDPQTVFVADDRSVANGGGIQKWTASGGVWTLQYTLAGSAGCRSVTGYRANGVTTLWATTGNQLVAVTDTGAGAPVTTIGSAATNTALRGVRFLGRPSTLQRLSGGCGAANIASTGSGEIGTDVVTSITGSLGLSFVGYGVQANAIPVCSCIVRHDFLVLFNGPQHTLSLPNNPALVGVPLYIQGVDFLAPSTCALPPFDLLTLTDAYSFTIQ